MSKQEGYIKNNYEPLVNKLNYKTEIVFDTFVHIFLISLALQIVFIMFLSRMETKFVREKIKSELVNTVEKIVLTKIEDETASALLKSTIVDNPYFEKSNSLAISQNWMFVTISGLLSLITYFILSKQCNFKDVYALHSTLIGNVILVIGVLVLEILFLNYVILEYKTFDSSLIVNSFHKRVRELLVDTDTPLESSHLSPVYIYPSYVVSFIVIFISIYLGKNKNAHSCYSNCPKSLGPYLLHIIKNLDYTSISCQAACIAIVVNAIFFTFGTAQEKLVIKGTIQTLTDSIYIPVIKFLNTLGFENVITVPDDIEPGTIDNSIAIKKAFIISGSIVGFFVIILITNEILHRRKGKKYNYTDLIRRGFISSMCSFISEFSFLNNVVSNYNMVQLKDVESMLLGVIDKK